MFRFPPLTISLCLTCALGISASLPRVSLHAQAAAPAAPLLDVHQLNPGDKGYGLTVFSGTEPERFDVEVISVLNNFLPHQDLVLIKTNHPRLQVTKVVAGMSGSPVFIKGKMIGAYAYGWQFGEEAVAGVTPISAMLDELKRPIPKEYLQPLPMPGANHKLSTQALATPKSTAGPGAFGQRFSGNVLAYHSSQHVQQIASRRPHLSSSAMGAAPIATPISVGGLTSSSLSWLHQQLTPLGLEPMQGAGAGKPTASTPSHYTNGGAIGVQFISGDISASGIGTVTRVQGNKVLAFGHPMTGGGLTRLPSAIAQIHWILASKARSFKIGAPVRPLGSLINDRQAAIVVDSDVQAPLIPINVELHGVPQAPHTRWSMNIVQDRVLAPILLSTAINNAIDSTVSDRVDTSWQATTTISLRGYGKVTVHDSGVSADSRSIANDFFSTDAMRSLGALLNNPWEPVIIERVDTRIDVRFSRDSLTLRGAALLTPEIYPGQKARIRLQLLPYSGPPQYRIVEVEIPRELAGTSVDIDIYPGGMEAPPAAAPENLRDLIAQLPNQSYRRDCLIAAVKVGGQGIAFAGQVATHLPPGAIYSLRSTTSNDSAEPVASLTRTEIPLRKIVSGTTSVRVTVRNSR